MFIVRTSAGRSRVWLRSIEIDRSTASRLSGWPTSMMTSSSSMSRSTRATSELTPRSEISLPRTCTSSSGNARSMVRSSSSRGPRRVTIGIEVGIVMMCVGTGGLGVVRSRSSRSLGADGWSASVIFPPVYVREATQPNSDCRRRPSSARRPRHPPSAEHVQVSVEHRLPGELPGVGDHPVPGLQPCLLRHATPRARRGRPAPPGTPRGRRGSRTCRRGMTRTCVGACGLMSRKATDWPVSRTTSIGTLPSSMSQKRHMADDPHDPGRIVSTVERGLRVYSTWDGWAWRFARRTATLRRRPTRR